MSLAGRGAEIKEHVLAVSFFGRNESFNPQTDAIVRTEASRLRAKLRNYYSTDGCDDPVIIELPPRTYVPAFRLREAPSLDAVAAADGPQRRRWLWVSTAALASALVFALYASYSHTRASGANHQATGAPGLSAVAVLPFVNADADPAVEQFANSLTEEVIEALAEVDRLRVVSRTSAFQFKGKQEDLKTIASKLNVETVLEGSVHRSGKQLHITGRLVNAADGHQYYAHAYEHELTDAFTVQREIAAHAANVLRVRQDGQEAARFTKSPEAHQKYLEGLHHASWNRESELREAIASYQQAISFDSNYSPAYVGLSEAYILLALLNEAPSREAMQRAAEAARAAVNTGGSYAHAHAALGSVLALHDWDWAGAEEEFRKAIDGDPNDSVILQQYAMRCLAPQGNLDSALFQLQVAQRVDPLSPEALLNRGRASYFKGDSARALRAFQSALELDPHLETAPLAMAQAYLQDSSFSQALKQLQESSAPTEDEARLAMLGSAYGLSGQPKEARQVLQQLLQVSRHQHISGFYLAQAYLSLGEIEPALAALEAAAEERSPLIVYVNVSPQFERLRAEPRFHALLKKIRLER